ncbi:MAG: molybdenum cofactor biosynthesis protein [Planctomycetes bacterium SCN 63-9]|nr:MAG: molybdenum cofactor biosynthesis protein [Planctomycetes bacterium SCN 63-9]
MSDDTVAQHHSMSPRSLNLAVMTVSDTRTLADDTSGALIIEIAEGAGHHVVEREIVPDEPDRMRPLFAAYSRRPDLHAVLVTGGTGISARDQTFETVSSLLTKPLPGYGELFRMLSYTEIGPACILSRAIGGLMDQLAILVMPGSTAAVKLAMNKIIIPELPHIVREALRHRGEGASEARQLPQ